MTNPLECNGIIAILLIAETSSRVALSGQLGRASMVRIKRVGGFHYSPDSIVPQCAGSRKSSVSFSGPITNS